MPGGEQRILVVVKFFGFVSFEIGWTSGFELKMI